MTVQELIDTLRRLDRQGLVLIFDPFAEGGCSYDLDLVTADTLGDGTVVVQLEAGGRA